MHELLDVDEFLNTRFESPVANAAYITARWNKLERELASHQSEQLEEFLSFTTQTQNQILSMWKPEFETPLSNRISNAPISPTSPTLFDGDADDYDYLDDGELAALPSSMRFSQEQHSIFMTTSSINNTKALVEGENLTNNNNNIGFATASGKSIKPPSAEAIAKVQALIQSEDDLQTKQGSTTPSKSMVFGFTSASGKKLKSPSHEAIAKSRALMEADNYLFDQALPTSPSSMLVGFSSASGKRIKSPSKEAMRRARSMLSDIDGDNELFHERNSPMRLSTFITEESGKEIKTPSRKPILHTESVICLTESNRDTPVHSIKVFQKDIIDSRYPNELSRQNNFELTNSRPLPQNSLSKNVKPSHLSEFAEGSLANHLEESRPLWPLANSKWINNHAFLILWKLFSLQKQGLSSFSFNNLITHLSHRYQREYVLVQRSILKRICERDESSKVYMVLFVSHVHCGNDITLSDGWYMLDAIIDEKIKRLVAMNKIHVGTKLKIAMSQIVSNDAYDILEAKVNNVKLKVHGNSMVPARWNIRLGKQRSNLFSVSLKSITLDGGIIVCVQVVVVRKYPTTFVVEFESGKRKSLCGSEFALLEQNQEETAVVDDRVSSAKITVRFLVADYSSNSLGSDQAVITLWESSSEVCDRLETGSVIQVTGLKLLMSSRSCMNLASTRGTQVIFVHQLRDLDLRKHPCSLFLDLIGQSEYDIAGYLVASDEDHLWILICGELDQIVAVRTVKKKLDHFPMKTFIALLNVVFLYSDPRFSFPVFLCGDHGEVIVDFAKARKHLNLPDYIPEANNDRILKARNFVSSLTLYRR